MKSYNHFLLALLLILILSFNSCGVVAGIFKAGMGFGIFIVVAITGLVLFLISRSRK